MLITLKDAHKKYKIPVVTIRSWIKKGILQKTQLFQDTKRSTIYIEELEIPTFIRNGYKSK